MDLFFQGVQILFQPLPLMAIMAGSVLGTISGALPGINSTMGIILFMTFTYTMSPLIAIAFLVAVYCSSVTGGSITAILIRIPGTPASAATLLDGYPMTQRGEGAKALSIALLASAFGGIMSAIAMFMLTQPLMTLALSFRSPEQSAVIFLGLSVLVFLDKGNMVKTFASALIGLWVGTVGLDFFVSVPRYTFGLQFLMGGIANIPVMVGMFALAEVLNQTNKSGGSDQVFKNAEMMNVDINLKKMVSLKEMWFLKWTMIRCSIVGTVTGILPGAGATIASFLGYATEVKFSKHPEKFGTGALEGLAGPETANNAATGGAMVPLMALGIPGGSAAAMIMAALSIHGVAMGPLLIRQQPEYISVLFVAMLFTNCFMLLVCFWLAKAFSRVMKLPYSVLGVIILMLSVVGSFSSSNSMNDVYIMAIAGIFGFFFHKYKYNHAAMILGMVLGRMCEVNFRRAMILGKDSLSVYFTSPISAAMVIIVIIMYLSPPLKALYRLYKLKKAQL